MRKLIIPIIIATSLIILFGTIIAFSYDEIIEIKESEDISFLNGAVKYLLGEGVSGSERDSVIGYQLYDDTLEIWNSKATYYFNRTSGIQWTEDEENYWTKNVFCLGEYIAGSWVKIKCADELGSFNKSISTDNSTYVNATLWKDFTHNGYDLRVGVRYNLKPSDNELPIIIYGKNKNSTAYPNKLGFMWKVKDIKIDSTLGDIIRINDSEYPLGDNLDIIFKDMSFTPEDNPTRDIPYYYLVNEDGKKYIRLRWNENLNYDVKLYSDGNQENSYVALRINGGIFGANQEKSTTIFWKDPIGDFLVTITLTGANSDPRTCGANDSNFWVNDETDNEIYIYWVNGSFDSNFDTGVIAPNIRGIATNDSDLFLMNNDPDAIFWVAPDGTEKAEYSLVGEPCGGVNPFGIEHYNGNLYIVDNTAQSLCKYDMFGNYISNCSITGNNSLNADPRGIAINGTLAYITDSADAEVYEYLVDLNNMFCNYTGFSWDTATNGNPSPNGIGLGNETFFVIESGVGNVMTYVGVNVSLPPTLSVTINNPLNITYNTTTILFNVTATSSSSIDTCLYSLDGGVNNFTMANITTSPDDYTATNSTMSQGGHKANFYCNDTLNDMNPEKSVSFSIDSISPVVDIISPITTVNYQKLNNNLTIEVSITDIGLESCWYDYNGTNNTFTCVDNAFQINITNQSNKNVIVYANDSVGNEGVNTTAWNYTILENFRTFNLSVVETEIDGFLLNVTADGTQTITAEFFYDGVSRGTSTKVGGNIFAEFNNTVEIPTVSSATNKSFFWQITHGSTLINTSKSNQTVSPIIFSLCNSTNNIAFLNFTFKNETVDEEDVSATINSNFVIWTTDQNTNKSFSFSNSSENPSYAFCLDHPDKSIFTLINLDYNNLESQQRTFRSTLLLTNLTTNRALYLLPTSLGLFSPFNVIDNNGDPIQDVLGSLTTVLSGVTQSVVSDVSDSSGFVSFFLNPDRSYSATFSKSGFENNIFTFVPTTDLRTVIMGSGAAIIGNGTEIAINTTYIITPINSTLQNNTLVTFGFEVTSSQSITQISMNITNSSRFQLGFVNSSSVGLITVNVNTENNTRIVGYYLIETSDETLSISKVWNIGIEFIGDYSLFNQLVLFMEYDFLDFIRYLIVILVIIGTLIFMSSKEVIESSESKVIVAVLLIWVFSIVGWIDTGLIVDSDTSNINVLGQFSNQYGIAILSTAIAVVFVFRRVFIRRI